jgi:serine protease Do
MRLVQSFALVAAPFLAAWPLAAQPAPRSPLGADSLYFDVAGGGPPSYLGVSIAEVDAARAKALKLPEERGVEITRVEPDSPADKAGLKTGDVVLEYNREAVEGMEQFGRMVRETPPGRRVTLKVSRAGALESVTATIGERKLFSARGDQNYQVLVPNFEMPRMEIPDIPEGFPGWRSGMLGIETEALTGQLSEYFGVKQGVLVRAVLSGSAAEKAGIRAGDVIVRVDDADVSTPGQVSAAVRAARSRHRVTLKIVRNHRDLSITAALEDEQPEGSRRVRTVSGDQGK